MLEKLGRWVRHKKEDAQDAVREGSEAFNKKHDAFYRKNYSIGKHLGHGAFNGAIAAMVIGAMPGEHGVSVVKDTLDAANNEWNRFVERQAKDKVAAYEEEMRLERKRSIEEMTPEFNAQIAELVKERTPDMTLVWLNGFSPDPYLNDMSKYEYLQMHFLAGGSGNMPEATAAPLRSLITRLVATESRFNTNAISKTKAFSAVQVVPSTFSDWYKFEKKRVLAPEEYEKVRNEFIQDFRQQVEFINWYFPYMYDRILADDGVASELGKIQEQFFPDDPEAFERYFVAPVLLNAYNAGYGTMEDVIEGIRDKVRSLRNMHPHSIPGQKYLAFYLLTEDTDFRQEKNAVVTKDPKTRKEKSRYFDAEKHDYVREILAFDELIAKMLKEGPPKIELASNSRKDLD